MQIGESELGLCDSRDEAPLAGSWELRRGCLARGGADFGVDGKAEPKQGAPVAVEQAEVTQVSSGGMTGLAEVILSAMTHPRTSLLLEMYRYTCRQCWDQ